MSASAWSKRRGLRWAAVLADGSAGPRGPPGGRPHPKPRCNRRGPPRSDLLDPTVVVLNDFCYVQGGASKVAIDEAVALARAGIEVIFFGAVGTPAAELRDAPLR